MKYIHLYTVIFFICFGTSCKKYLDKKPDVKLAIPSTLDDFQKLMDYNEITDAVTPQVGDLGCDDYFWSDSMYLAAAVKPRNCYSWASDTWEGTNANDWTIPYGVIYTCNVVIEGLDEFKEKNAGVNFDTEKWNSVYGHALFVRASLHYYLEEIFGQPFRPSSIKTDLGIPLKLTANLESVSSRSTVQEVYEQITNDLLYAKSLLPKKSIAKSRPSKAAAFGMLARIYLTMQDYVKAGAYADSSLQLFSTLFDYNNALGTTNPFSQSSPPTDLEFETLYTCFQVNYSIIRLATTNIDWSLYNSYDANDLRKTVFFLKNSTVTPNTYYFKGNYSGSTTKQFSGPAVDEMYLIKAECYARLGSKDSAMANLNLLLKKRWNRSVVFQPIVASNDEEALRKTLLERRKELIFRGIRWTDLRRLNQDPRFALTLTRTINGQTYQLPPNDKRYTYPIPDNEIRLSGIQQNPR